MAFFYFAKKNITLLVHIKFNLDTIFGNIMLIR